MHHSPSYGQVSEGSILDGPSFAECLSTCLLCLAVSYPYYIMPSESLDFVYLVVIYPSIFIIIWRFILWCKSFRIPKKFHGLVAVLFFVVICYICDKLVTGKSDAFSIISYGSFALMSLSMSRKSELGFKKGFFTCLLSLFVEQVSKIMWILLPIAAVSGQSLLSRNNQRNNQEESPQAMHHSTSNGEVLEGSMLDLDNLQNNEQEEYESSDQYHVSSGNNMLTIQNGWMHSSGEPALISSAPPLDCGGGTQLNVWRFHISDGTHSINPRLMCDPVRRIWLCLEEAELVFRVVEEADLELTMRPEMRILVKPPAADSADDLRTSSPTSVLQLRADAEAEEEEEETVEKCQDVTRT